MTLRNLLAILGVVIGIALYFAPPPEGVSRDVMQVAGVVAVTVALWATAVVPEYFTAILFFFFAVALTGLTPKIVFSGFQSAAAWMIFGGLIIGAAVQSTGLGARLARVLLERFGRSYLGLLFGTVAVAALAAFVLPTNTGRVLVLVPIFMSLADRLGFDQGSNGRTALALAVGAGTLYPGLAILPSAIPNLVLMGAAESIHGIVPTYGGYFLLHFPVIGLVSIIALPLILRALFPDTPRHQASVTVAGTINRDERKLFLLLLAALALWATDFAHGISPAWIALGAGLLCLVPRIGVLAPSAIVDKINLAPWFFIAGVVGMAAAVSASGLGDLVGRQLFDVVKLEPGQDALNFAAVSAMGMVIGLITTVPGEPAIMSALADEIAISTGWPLYTVLMAQVIAWTMTPLPYALPPLVIAAQLAGARTSHLLRLLLAMTALAWIVMLPLQYLWWRMLDMFT